MTTYLIHCQITALKKALQEGRYKNKYALEGKIKKLENKLKLEQQKGAWYSHLAR